jgi:hypothetical protein
MLKHALAAACLVAVLSGCTHTRINQSSSLSDPTNPDAPETPIAHAPSLLAAPPPIVAEDAPETAPHMDHMNHMDMDHTNHTEDMEGMDNMPPMHHETHPEQKGRPQ